MAVAAAAAASEVVHPSTDRQTDYTPLLSHSPWRINPPRTKKRKTKRGKKNKRKKKKERREGSKKRERKRERTTERRVEQDQSEGNI